MNQFEGSKATIKLSSVEQKQTKTGATLVHIKDENDKKYSFFTTKMDGNETAAWREFKNAKIGDTLELGYVEQEYDYETPTGEKKKGTRRTVRFLSVLNNTVILNPNGTVAPGQNVRQNEVGDIVIDNGTVAQAVDDSIPF